MHFKKINTFCGWLVFLAASGVYLRTIEPSVSFWDCGEFISCAFRLEIGHQPGAPFYMLLGRFFSLFAGNHPEMVAKMINSLSAIASGFAMMFLYWTITRLTARLITDTGDSPVIRPIRYNCLRSGRSYGLHLFRYILVFGSGRRGLCNFGSVHCGRLLGNS